MTRSKPPPAGLPYHSREVACPRARLPEGPPANVSSRSRGPRRLPMSPTAAGGLQTGVLGAIELAGHRAVAVGGAVGVDGGIVAGDLAEDQGVQGFTVELEGPDRFLHLLSPVERWPWRIGAV